MLFLPHPDLLKDLVEEHQRELLEEVEAEELAEGEVRQEDEAYLPVTDSEDDLVPTHKRNRRVKGSLDKQISE